MNKVQDLLSRVEKDFAFHEVDEGQKYQMAFIRELCKELAINLVLNMPPGRELSSALTNLEQVMFHANAGISRKEKPDESKTVQF